MNNTLNRRNAHFMAAVRRTAAAWQSDSLGVTDIVSCAATGPAPEFYVTYDTAWRYTTMAMRGKLPATMSRTRRRMWTDLASRVSSLMRRKPVLTFGDALSCVLATGTAPSFYITPRYARNLYYKLVNHTIQ